MWAMLLNRIPAMVYSLARAHAMHMLLLRDQLDKLYVYNRNAT